MALAIALASATAHAQPAVDVSDLPPLPPATDDESSSATVLAASAAAEDVVVGAAKREQSLGNVASAVTVISADRIRRFGYRTVGEAVAGVAGAYLEDNRLVGSLGIRGLDIPGDYNTRVLVLIDGATVNEAWGAFAGLGFDTFISIDDVARIEVIRGPVSSVYGANAFFGIINIVTRGAAETPRAWGRIGMNAISGAVASAGFSAGGMQQQIRGSVLVADRFGESLVLPEVGSSLGSDRGLSYAASIVGSYNGSFAQVRAYRYRRDDALAPYNADPTASVPYSEYDTQLLVEGGHTHELSKRFTIAARGYVNLYQFYDHIIQLDAMPPFEDYGDAATFGAELRGRYEIDPGKLGLTTGLEANYNITESHSFAVGMEDAGALVDKNFDIEGAYAELDGQPLPWLGFVGGVRFDRNSVIQNRLSPRAALFISKPEQYGVKLLYAEGFRNPSAYEAFFFDNSSFAKPDNLGPETIRSLEAVLWAKPMPGLSLRASGFYWDARGIITAEPFTDPVTGADLQQFQNAGRLVTAGVEVEGSYRDASGWYVFGGGAVSEVGTDVDGQIEYGGVPDAAEYTAAGGVSTPLIAGKAHVSTELLFVGARPTRPNTDTGEPESDAPAWLGWNAAVYAPNVRGVDITVGVRNILGKREYVVAPGDYDRARPDMTTITIPRVPGEGRELYAKVGYSF